MRRVAAIDCGTNSIRLLVTDLDGDHKHDLAREMRIVRLGQGVDRTGRLDAAALARTVDACAEYAQIIREHGASRIRFCATSATRDASNADTFNRAVYETFEVEPDVLSGAEEAALTFMGAARDLPDLPDPVLVVDIGGGSTELIVGSAGEVDVAASVDIGSVRLTERHLADDPPTAEQIESCVRDIDADLDASGVALTGVRSFVGVAGTITTLAAHVLDLAAYDPERVHHTALRLHAVDASCNAIIGATVQERRAMPFMHPGRADVIAGGALILQRVIARLGLEEPTLLTSEHDILDGIAWSLA